MKLYLSKIGGTIEAIEVEPSQLIKSDAIEYQGSLYVYSHRNSAYFGQMYFREVDKVPVISADSAKFHLSLNESKRAASNPDALRAIANDHEVSALEADAIGEMTEAVKFHENRRDELRNEADRIEADL